MYTVYNGIEYRFTECFVYKGKYVSGLSTNDIERVDDSFVFFKEKNIYFKFLDIAELSTLYDVILSAEYITEIEKIRKEFNIRSRLQIDSEKKRVHLINVDDYFSGWTMEERGVYTKWANISELSNFKTIYQYFVKNGKELDSPLYEKREIEYRDDTEIIKKMVDIFEYYDKL